MTDVILALNAGSSSIKFSLFVSTTAPLRICDFLVIFLTRLVR